MNSNNKGKRGELEVARILRENGFEDARRTAQYCGNTGDAADVVGLDGFHLEVKRCETIRIMEWLKQAIRDCKGKIPLVVFRRNNDEWFVCLRLVNFLDLLKKIKKLKEIIGIDKE